MSRSNNPLGLADPSLFIQQAFKAGEWICTDSKIFDVINPSTGLVIGTCPEQTVDDCKVAIDEAYETFHTFSLTSPQYRADILSRLHILMLEIAEDLARLLTWENGKCLNDARAEVKYAASYIQWYAGEALRMYGRVIPSSLPESKNFTIQQPIGVAGLLLPWNFPLGMLARKIGPAVAVGCTTVTKLPSETPFACLASVELARRAGMPPGVIQIITTEANLQAIGKELCENPKVKKISFTGSTRVGKLLLAQCVGTLKKTSLELGGNAPFIVFEDANVKAAVQGAVASKFRGGGQTCVCAQRIYVHESVYDDFAQGLVTAVGNMKVGDGFGEGITMGPLIHERAVEKCNEHVRDAVRRGAKVLIGGVSNNGCFFYPTVLSDAPNDCLLIDEETFGPVAALIKFSTEEEVIRLANAVDVGLAGYFFSENANRIWRVAEVLQTGMIGVNTGIISQAVIPFGGVKESGWGKEGGSEGTSDFCVTKMVCVGTTSSV